MDSVDQKAGRLFFFKKIKQILAQTFILNICIWKTSNTHTWLAVDSVVFSLASSSLPLSCVRRLLPDFPNHQLIFICFRDTHVSIFSRQDGCISTMITDAIGWNYAFTVDSFRIQTEKEQPLKSKEDV